MGDRHGDVELARDHLLRGIHILVTHVGRHKGTGRTQ